MITSESDNKIKLNLQYPPKLYYANGLWFCGRSSMSYGLSAPKFIVKTHLGCVIGIHVLMKICIIGWTCRAYKTILCRTSIQYSLVQEFFESMPKDETFQFSGAWKLQQNIQFETQIEHKIFEAKGKHGTDITWNKNACESKFINKLSYLRIIY